MTLGLAAAFLRESLDHTVRSPEDVTRVLNLPCLGVIPALEPSRSKPGERTEGKGRSEAMRQLVELQNSGAWEAYRSLRTAIVYSTDDPTPRAIMVASPLPAEGRTFTVINLAARHRGRVDTCNIRKSFGAGKLLTPAGDYRAAGARTGTSRDFDTIIAS